MPNPNQLAVASYKQAKLLEDQGDFKGAVAAYRQAIKNGLEEHDVWFSLGLALTHLHEHEESLECWNTILKRETTNPLVFNNQADSLLHLRRFEEAIIAAKRAVELGAFEGWHTLAECYEALGQNDAAINALESFISQASSDYNALKHSATQTVERLKRVSQAPARDARSGPEILQHFMHTRKRTNTSLDRQEGLDIDVDEAEARRKARMAKLMELKRL